MRDDTSPRRHGRRNQAGDATPGLVTALAALVVVVLVVLVSLRSSDPSPAPLPADAPQEVFSAARAMEHVRALSEEPRPTGSPAHALAREYILSELRKLGLEPEVDEDTVLDGDLWGVEINAVRARNIFVRLPGASGPAAKSLLVMAHYDSVPTGPGAADDASSVAAILESIRAIRAGEALPHDVLILFTDAEEVGLSGAFGFTRHHPWMSEVGLVLNFEARGNHGPVRMFRTSGGNRWLIEQLAAAAPEPVASSVYYEAYKRLPNDTDLTAFLRAGTPGMDFAFIEGFPHYHSALDTADALDPASVQHQGSYLMSLIRAFSAADLSQARGGDDAIFFNPVGGWLVVYPVAWALPLAVVAAVLFLAVLFLGFRRHRLSPASVLAGFGGTLLAALVCAGIAHLLWQQVFALDSDFRWLVPGQTYDLVAYLWGFALLGTGLGWLVCRLLTRRGGEAGFTAGAALVWLVATAATSVLVPGVSYVFLWPTVFALAGLAWLVSRDESAASGWIGLVVASLAALPVLLLLPPLLAALFEGLGVSVAAVMGILVALGLALTTPLWSLAARRFKLLPPVALLLAGLGILGWAAMTATAGTAEDPRTDSLLYGLDAQNGEAWWFSYGHADAWTEGYLGEDPQRMPLDGFEPWPPRRGFLVGPAPALPLSPPQVELVERSEETDPYRIVVRLRSERGAGAFYLKVETLARIETLTIDGRRWDFGVGGLSANDGGRWLLRYLGATGEPVELTFELDQQQPLELRLVDQTFGLPAIDDTVPARPSGSMANPYGPLTDVTLVSSRAYY
ncbi:MAG: M20/M25/M40 family metallo-hydrolase [Acidobacteria bacterium]|nr:M20/M25/M40 family metallo-hydrolase [Acidobacteriota bacterium]